MPAFNQISPGAAPFVPHVGVSSARTVTPSTSAAMKSPGCAASIAGPVSGKMLAVDRDQPVASRRVTPLRGPAPTGALGRGAETQ